MNKINNVLVSVWRFYRDGFRSMTVGRYLWAMIIVKVIVVLVLFGMILLPNKLNKLYDTDAEKSQAVRSALISTPQ